MPMKMNEILMLFAVLLSPLVAVQVQRWLERFREKRNAKMWVFQTLMATRTVAARISPEHARALNMIDLTFHGGLRKRPTKAEKLVLDAWKKYFDQLNIAAGQGDALRRWAEKRDELFVNLLHAMSEDLGYSFDRLQLMRNFYAPIAQGTLEAELNEIRTSVLGVLRGRSPIAIKPWNEQLPPQ
jgi:uncharacterized protein DUF6680